MSEFAFVSADGTTIRGWTNDGAGLPVLLVPGNATTPEGFPSLQDPDNGMDVTSFYMRGTFGSERPADPERIRVAHHVEDALAVLDERGIEKAVVVGWSLGVNVAFEFARRHPERTIAVVAIGGVPGGTHATLWHPFPMPRRMRTILSYGLVTLGQAIGPLARAATYLVPDSDASMRVVIRMGLIGRSASPTHLAAFLRRVARQDIRWVSKLARAGFEHPPMEDLHLLPVPIAFLAGTRDWLTSPKAIAEAAARIPHATFQQIPATHTIGIEHPERILAIISGTAARPVPEVELPEQPSAATPDPTPSQENSHNTA